MKRYVVDVVAYVDLLEMYLIFENVGKHFIVASQSPGRTPLINPSKSYVVDVVAFSNLKMFVEVFIPFSPFECHVHPLFIVVRDWARLLVIGQRMSF